MTSKKPEYKEKDIPITVTLLLLVTLLAASYICIIFSQQAMAQTPSLTLDQRCVGNQVVGIFTLTGFPEGNTVLTRSDLPTGAHITTFLVPSSGTITFELQGLL